MNYKLLKSTLVVAALSGTIIGCGDNKTSAQHFASGETYKSSGDLNAAIIEYKNALQKDPSNANARLALGKIYQAKGDLPAAKKELALAIEQNATRRDAIIHYATVLNDLGDSQEVLDLPLFAASLSSEGIVHAHFLRGKSYARLNDEIHARTEFEKCSEMIVKSDYIPLCKATIALLEKELAAAAGIVDRLVERRPDMAEALMLSGSINSANGEYTKAVNAYKLHIKHHKKRAGLVNLLLAEALINNGQPDEATIEINAILDINRLQPLANYLKARIEFEQENFQLALLHASNTIKAIPSHRPANLIGGIAAFRVSDFEQSYRMLTKVERQITGNTLPIIMNVINNLKRGNIKHARTLLEKTGQLNDKNRKLFMVAANEFRVAQDYITAMSILEKVKVLTPDSNPLKLAIGGIKIQMGDPSGIDELKQTILDPQLSEQSIQLLSAVYLKMGRKSELIDIANMLKDKLPQSKNGWLLAGSLAIDSKDFVQAKKEFKHLLEFENGRIDALRQLTQISIYEKKYDDALTYIDKALIVEPSNINLVRLKGKAVFGATQDNSLAQDVVIKAYEEFSDDNHLIVERALIHATNNETKQGILLLASISDKENLSSRYWNSYGRLLMKDGRNGEALNIFQKWTEAKPNIPGPMLKQIALTERMSLYPQGLGIIAKGQKNFPHIAEFHLLEVSFLMMDDKVKEARAKFNRLTIKDFDNINYKLVKGELLVAEGKYQASVAELLPVYKESQALRSLRALAAAYTLLDQESKLIPLLEQHLKIAPSENFIKPLLAAAYTKIGNGAKAQEFYQESLKSYPDNPVILNNLAWVLYSDGEYKRALEYADKAISKAASNPQILDTHGMILLKLEKFEDAKVSLERALSLQPKDFTINAHNAQLALRNGDDVKAKQLLNKVAAQTKAEKELFNEVSKEF